MSESIYDFVMSELASSRGKLPEIAQQTEIPLSTLRKIYSRTVTDPSVHTIEKLAKHFRDRSAAAPQRFSLKRKFSRWIREPAAM